MPTHLLLRLVNFGAFDCLRRTPDLNVFAADHDEMASDSWDRLSRIRNEPPA
jgi:hypothetical protein